MIPSNSRIFVLMLSKNPGSGVSTCRDHALHGYLRVRGARKHSSRSALTMLRQHRIEGKVGLRDGGAWRIRLV